MSTPPFPQDVVETALRQISASHGFNAWLSIDLVRAYAGEVELTIPLKPEVTQHHGFVHGGVIGAVADTACAWAAGSAVGDVVTTSYTIQFLAPAKGDRLRAKAQVLKTGKRSVAVEARVFAEAAGEEPKLVAVALASIAPLGTVPA